MELFEAIKTRRSMRRYKPDPVDDEKIEAILEAGRWAPSWANTQCWHFVVARDAAVRAKLADAMVKFGENESPAAVAMRTVPVVIAVCAEMGKSGCMPGPGGGGTQFVTDKGDWFMFDTALAVQNMVLAAHAQGLGTVILGLFDARKAEEALGLPDTHRIVAMFPVGVPDQEGKAPPRKELTEIVSHDTWGK